MKKTKTSKEVFKTLRKKRKKIKYGKASLPKGFTDPSKAKVKVSLFLDGDLILALKNKFGYQYENEINNILKSKIKGTK